MAGDHFAAFTEDENLARAAGEERKRPHEQRQRVSLENL